MADPRDPRELRFDDLGEPTSIYDRIGPGAGTKGLGPTENKAAAPEPEVKKKPARKKAAAKKEVPS